MFIVYAGDEILTDANDKDEAVDYADMYIRQGKTNVYIVDNSTGEIISQPRQ